MASITIRNLDDNIKRRLKVRAAVHGRSMEKEARHILRRVMGDDGPPRKLAAAIRARIAPEDRAELELPVREAIAAERLTAGRLFSQFNCQIAAIASANAAARNTRDFWRVRRCGG